MISLAIILALLTPVPQASCKEKSHLETLVRRSGIIVVAQVTDAERRSGTSSGTMETEQYSTYVVKEVIKGEVKDKDIKVGHPLYRGSLTADREIPRLSPVLFKTGNTLILFLNVEKRLRMEEDGTGDAIEMFIARNADCGAIALDANVVKDIKRILSKPSLNSRPDQDAAAGMPNFIDWLMRSRPQKIARG